MNLYETVDTESLVPAEHLLRKIDAAINSVANGGAYIQAELVTGLLEVRDITQTFTKKEKLVADTLTIHNTNAEVAATLGIAEKTVVNYLTILYDKAGVENKLQFLEKMGRL